METLDAGFFFLFFSLVKENPHFVPSNTNTSPNLILEFLFSLFIAQGFSHLFVFSRELWTPQTCCFMFLGIPFVAVSTWNVLSCFSPLEENPNKTEQSQKVTAYPYFLLVYHYIFYHAYEVIDYTFPARFVYELQEDRHCFLFISMSSGPSIVPSTRSVLCVLNEWRINERWNIDWKPKHFYKFVKESVISPVENEMELCHTMGYRSMLIWKMYFHTFTPNALQVEVISSCNVLGCWNPWEKTLHGKYTAATATRKALGSWEEEKPKPRWKMRACEDRAANMEILH